MTSLFETLAQATKPEVIKRFDLHGVELKDGDIIDIHQTVNGQDKFIIVSVCPLEVVYAFDPQCKYQYNKEELLSPCRFNGEVDWEIVGNVSEVNNVRK